MASTDKVEEQESPKPDPSLKRLDRLVGTWDMRGRPVGAEKDSITGTTTFAWVHGAVGTSFFLQQDMDMDYAGTRIKSREIIGHDPKTKAFTSYVYSNMAPDPWPYQWDVDGDALTISITYGEMNATFRGRFSPDGLSFSGGWRPNPGADEKINAPYDVTVTRTKGTG